MSIIETDVVGCTRCWGDHGTLEFHELTNPVGVDDDVFTHWAPCPTNGEPILLLALPEEE